MIKTARELKAAITPEIIEVGRAVFTAIAHIETIKPVVRKYQNEILAKHQFKTDIKWSRRGLKQKVITKESESYMMNDEDAKVYFSELSAAHKEHGFNVPEDHCPLLIAENLKRKAFWSLVDVMSPITGINKDNLINLNHIKEYETITLKMIASHIG